MFGDRVKVAPAKKIPKIDASKTPKRPAPVKPMTPEDKAYSDMLKKANYDATKVKGFSFGKGVE